MWQDNFPIWDWKDSKTSCNQTTVREKSLSSLLYLCLECGETPSPQPAAGGQWAGGPRVGTHLFPPKDPAALGTILKSGDLFCAFKWYWEPFEAKWGGYFCVVPFSFSFFFFFPFSQGFPKWMAVKDFNILQAQQLILKSLAEGFYRGKLGCKSFWRLFPFWNL